MHDRLSINSIGFAADSFEQLARHWRDINAKRVSFVSLTLESDSTQAARQALQDGGFLLETIIHPFMPGQPLEPREDSWQEAREKLKATIESASQLNARSLYLTTGGHGSGSWEDSARAFAEAVAPCAALARERGLALMIENAPPLYADMHIAHSLRDTVTLAEMADIGVCIDIASCWTEAGLQESIQRAAPRCGLVQVSDYVLGDRALPSRAVPGDGVIPLSRLFGWILEAGYQGVFDLELLGPRIEREGHRDAMCRAAEYTGKLLHSLGA